ncbi:hypothetical protein M0805_004705 [Coniferiporia weirii]|nr:hypothetical protein M0805_004705 [Coniferiporia weirii]
MPSTLPSMHPNGYVYYYPQDAGYFRVPVFLDHRADPWLRPILLKPPTLNYPAYYRQQYVDPRMVPQGDLAYARRQLKPRVEINRVLKNAHYVHLDLSSSTYLPLAPSRGWGEKEPLLSDEGVLTWKATRPGLTKMVITCPELGSLANAWAIVIKSERTISVGDILRAVYKTLQTLMTSTEKAKLSSSEQSVANSAYRRRCDTLSFNKMRGPQRVDLLGDKSWFGGIVKAEDGDPHHFELLVRSK